MNRTIEISATCLLAIAILHTFFCNKILAFSHRYRKNSVPYNLLHVLGEVEIVFGLWAGVLVLFMYATLGEHESIQYLESLNFTEPLFVFVVMAISATRPIVNFAQTLIFQIARILPFSQPVSRYLTCLIIGPLLGSFITEPAAMTVTALILRDAYFNKNLSPRFKYITLACLFVNISIGGVLTHFAAPPVLMVASTWKWDTSFMLTHFGLKAFIAVTINAGLASLFLGKEISTLTSHEKTESPGLKPILTCIHLFFLVFTVLLSHHPVMFLGLFLFFLGITVVTSENQDKIKIRESLLVGFFLGGLVVLGSFQRWWLEPLIGSMSDLTLFLGSTGLTAFTDNAAITYLGSQIPNASESFKYALVAGAVTGGGLTVIANAPNPAGFSILNASFGKDGVQSLQLLLAALLPTLIAALCFWFIPTF